MKLKFLCLPLHHDFNTESLMKRIIFTGIVLLLLPFFVSGQRYISGKVTDNADGGSIPGASVFIAETTVGISTDTAGYFRLALPGPGSYRLVVSHAGYQAVYYDIEPGKESVVYNVSLLNRVLDEVRVVEKIKVRQTDVDLFWNVLLGEKPSRRTIFVENPQAPYFYYNKQTNTLKVTCREMINIVNVKTGFYIQVLLDNFTHDYNTNTSFWKYHFTFTELYSDNQEQRDKWESNRKNVYAFSFTHFIRSLYNNTMVDDGFLFVRQSLKSAHQLVLTPYSDPTTFYSIDPKGEFKEFFVPEKLDDLI